MWRRDGVQRRPVRDRLRRPDELRRFVRGPHERYLQLRQMWHGLQGSSERHARLHRDMRFPMHAAVYPLRCRLCGCQPRHEQLWRVRHEVSERAQRDRHVHQQWLRNSLQRRLHALLRHVRRYAQRQLQLRRLRGRVSGGQQEVQGRRLRGRLSGAAPAKRFSQSILEEIEAARTHVPLSRAVPGLNVRAPEGDTHDRKVPNGSRGDDTRQLVLIRSLASADR